MIWLMYPSIHFRNSNCLFRKKNFIKIFKTRTLIQVFLLVGGENGILVKNYLKIPISPLSSISSKYQNLHLKLERFKIKKIEVEKMVWLFQVEKMGSPYHTVWVIPIWKSAWVFPVYKIQMPISSALLSLLESISKMDFNYLSPIHYLSPSEDEHWFETRP